MKQVTEVQKKYPKAFAKKAAELYPVKERIDSIEVTKWKDSIVTIIETQVDTLLDTAWISCEKLQKQRDKYKYLLLSLKGKVIHSPAVIKYMEDTLYLNSIRDELKTANAEKEKYHKRYDNWLKVSIAFLLILILSLLAHLIRNFLK